jgi:hypothetical protein
MATGRRGKRIFSYDEALATFPFVRDLTAAAQRRLDAVLSQVENQEELEARREEIEAAVQRIVAAWTAEVTGVGCEVKGVWLVDWDSGDGYYCWKFPEETVSHYHGYDEGFAGRVPIN